MINKLITEDDLYGAVDAAFAEGWSRVKLYFLIGLPTETDEDTLGIAELARNCVDARPPPQRPGVGDGERRRASCPSRTRRSSGSARTPAPSCSARSTCCAARPHRARNVNLKWHDPAATVAEGILSRGDRRIGRVVERVWRAGGTFQEWGEHFDLRRWTDALEAEGLSLDWYVHRHRDRAEVLPWAHLTAGLHEDFLWDDWQAARSAAGGDRRLPLDAVLRLRGVHRVRHRARRGLARRAGRRQPGHRPGPRPRRRPSRRAAGAPAVKLRLRYAKRGKVRFTSHRDTARIWERAMRRAGVPVADERRVHAPAAAELRPGPADGRRVGGRVPRRSRCSTARCRPTTSTTLPARARRGAPGRVRGAAWRSTRSRAPGRCRRRSRR